MTTSQKGEDFIKSFEKCSLHPYLDAIGKATVGWGNTFYEDGTKVNIKNPSISQSRADRLFDAILLKFETDVNKILTNKGLSQHQYDAIISFAYNCGLGNLKGSTLLKKVNLDESDLTIPAEFKKWVNSGGKPLNGLIDRRNKESDIYSKGIYVNHN